MCRLTACTWYSQTLLQVERVLKRHKCMVCLHASPTLSSKGRWRKLQLQNCASLLFVYALANKHNFHLLKSEGQKTHVFSNDQITCKANSVKQNVLGQWKIIGMFHTEMPTTVSARAMRWSPACCQFDGPCEHVSFC